MTMNNQSRRHEVQNRASNLLSGNENDKLFNLLGKRSTTLATSVVQMLFALSTSRDKWTKQLTGVACFVKDNTKRSYFIRVYDITESKMVWEQELYNNFKYLTPRTYFHTFAADKFQAGLNFCDENEASTFRQEIEKKIKARENRRQGRKSQTSREPAPPPALGADIDTRNRAVRTSVNLDNNHMSNKLSQSPSLTSLDKKVKKKDKNKNKNKTKKITKDDIGLPSNFQHVGHVGWDAQEGFDINKLDDNWKMIFSKAGVTDNELNDQETAKFIYDFVEKHGGVENFNAQTENLQSRESPPAPIPVSDIPPPPPARGNGPPRVAPPPPPPSRGYSQAPPPPPPSRGLSSGPPPPPPSRAGPPPPPSRGAPRSPKSMGGAVPPPPAPPPLGAPVPPPPPPIIQGGGPPPPPPTAGRGDLLSQIQSGTTLKKVDPNEKPSGGGDGRNSLLSDIRTGVKLRTVSHEEAGQKPASDAGLDGIAGALARALQERSKAIHSSDEDEESGSDFEDEEDEWDD